MAGGATTVSGRTTGVSPSRFGSSGVREVLTNVGVQLSVVQVLADLFNGLKSTVPVRRKGSASNLNVMMIECPVEAFSVA